MSLYRVLHRPLCTTSRTFRRPFPSPALPSRGFSFSATEEAAAERRRRKHRLHVEPPLHALRRTSPPPSNTSLPLPESTGMLVGKRLQLHIAIQNMIRSDKLNEAVAALRSNMFSNCRPTIFTCNAVMGALLRSGRHAEVLPIFQLFTRAGILPNVVSYNVLIKLHCDAGRVDDALKIYRAIIADLPFSPTNVTFCHLTKGLIDADRLPEAVSLLREMLASGHAADSLVYNNLIGAYFDIDDIPKALDLLDELRERCVVYDGVVVATVMDRYFQRGMEKEAIRSYQEFLAKEFKMSAATCNTLLETLSKYNRMNEADNLFNSMLVRHNPPHFVAMNVDSYKIMVNKYFDRGEFAQAMTVLKKKPSKRCQLHASLFNDLMKRFLGKEMILEMEEVLKEMPEHGVHPDAVSLDIMVNNHLKKDLVEEAVEGFKKVVDAGLKVETSACNKIIEEFLKKDNFSEAQQVFTTIGAAEGVKRDSETYEIMFKEFLCKHGKSEEGWKLLEEMAKNGLLITHGMRETAMEVFGKEGRGEDLERLIEENKEACQKTPETKEESTSILGNVLNTSKPTANGDNTLKSDGIMNMIPNSLVSSPTTANSRSYASVNSSSLNQFGDANPDPSPFVNSGGSTDQKYGGIVTRNPNEYGVARDNLSVSGDSGGSAPQWSVNVSSGSKEYGYASVNQQNCYASWNQQNDYAHSGTNGYQPYGYMQNSSNQYVIASNTPSISNNVDSRPPLGSLNSSPNQHWNANMNLNSYTDSSANSYAKPYGDVDGSQNQYGGYVASPSTHASSSVNANLRSSGDLNNNQDQNGNISKYSSPANSYHGSYGNPNDLGNQYGYAHMNPIPYGASNVDANTRTYGDANVNPSYRNSHNVDPTTLYPDLDMASKRRPYVTAEGGPSQYGFASANTSFGGSYSSVSNWNGHRGSYGHQPGHTNQAIWDPRADSVAQHGGYSSSYPSPTDTDQHKYAPQAGQTLA